jgi:hypothetical protein
VNVEIGPRFSKETESKIQQENNSTGAPNQPRVSVSNLSDPKNADLKAIIDAQVRPKEDGRPGPGSRKLRERIVSLLSDKKFDGRMIIFPVTASADDFMVLRVESAPKSRKSINNLPDAAFAVIERGGKKDKEGKTAPRSLRHLPHHASSVKDPSEDTTLDLPRLRNALARMNQVKASGNDSTARIQRIAKAHLIRHAKKALPKSKFAESKKIKLSEIINELDVEICDRILNGDIKADAQLMEVNEESTVKLFRLKMGEKDRPVTFFVRVRFDSDNNAQWIEFDFDTILPARAIPDFAKFLRGLPKGD